MGFSGHRNKVQAWANKPISTKEYVNLIDSKDRFILNITDPEKVKASPILQNIINFGISTVGATLLTTKYSRMCEKEADIEAAKTMLENKQGYINFLRNLQENTEENKTSKFEFKQAILDYLDPIIGLFRTHPTCDERIAYINEIE